MPGDLHTHTTFSDGSTPADKLPFLAACAGMTHLAISDHDSIRSVRYAYAHPVQNGVHLIPATELTAYDYERAHRVHLLCMVSAVPHKQRFWFVRFYNCRFYRCGTDIQSQQKIFLLSA